MGADKTQRSPFIPKKIIGLNCVARQPQNVFELIRIRNWGLTSKQVFG